jgi:hypothetical protein
MRKVNEMLIIFAQLLNNCLISLKLSRGVLHGVQNENSFWNIIIFVGGEPIWEDCVWGS